MEELGLFLGLGDDANYQLANPSLLAYYKELNERRLWLDCEVDDEAIGDMCRQIIRWNKEDDAIEPSKRKKIIIYFVSPGGSLDSYLWLKDVINLSITPIVGIMMSRTASAAALIFIAMNAMLLRVQKSCSITVRFLSHKTPQMLLSQ